MSLRPSLCVAGASELEGLSLPPAGERRHSELLFTHHRLWWGWITGGARGLWKKRSNQMRRSEAMHWRHKQLIDRGIVGTQRHRLGVTTASCFLIMIEVHFKDSIAKKKKEKVPSDLSTQSNISQTGVGFFVCTFPRWIIQSQNNCSMFLLLHELKIRTIPRFFRYILLGVVI